MMNVQSTGSAKGRSAHPGSGRRKAALFPKGHLQQSEETKALKALRVVLGDAPLGRVRLIEYLHQIQDREGCLPARHLHALAEELRRGMPQV